MRPLFDPFDDAQSLDWTPRVDIYRTPEGWVLKFDLAGVKPQDVEIVAEGSILRVSGVRRDGFVERGYRHHIIEISYSRFERVLQLPCVAEGCSMKTDYDAGMLIISIASEAKP